MTLRGVGTATAAGEPASAEAPGPSPDLAPDAAPARAAEDPWIGRTVAERYLVISRLGEGGMAVVYEAESLTIKKRVALKVAHPSPSHGAEIAARFRREIEASARIEHPHVVQAIDGGALPSGEAFLVTQLVRGESLATRLARGPIPWAEAAGIATQLADALSAIHAAGFVHRDLTPSNVLLASGQPASTGGAPHVYVLDLGIAAVMEDKGGRPPTAPYLTVKGTTVGTPGYMSPEQAVGRPVDGRSDLYALGLLFFEMVQGQRVLASDVPLSALATRLFAEELELPGPSSMPAPLFTHARALLFAERSKRPPDAAAVRAGFAPFTTGGPPQLADAVRGATQRSLDGARARWKLALARIVSQLETAGASLGDTARRVQQGKATGRDRWIVGLAAALSISTLALFLFAIVHASSDGPASPGAAAISPAVGASAPSMPEGVEVPVGGDAVTERALLSGRTRAIREEAAGVILSAEDGVYPRYARLVSVLTLARTCDARRAQIEAIAALGDPRALPALERIAEAPRAGCGRRSREDCYACVREAVRDAVARLGATP